MRLYADSTQLYATGFQDPASTWMIGIIDLHDSIMFYLIIIFFLVSWMGTSALINKDHLKY